MMITLKITAKGQVTLKQELLRHLGVKSGQNIDVETLPDGRAVIRAKRDGPNIDDAFGMLKAKNKRNIVLTVDEMNAIAREGWRSKK